MFKQRKQILFNSIDIALIAEKKNSDEKTSRANAYGQKLNLSVLRYRLDNYTYIGIIKLDN